MREYDKTLPIPARPGEGGVALTGATSGGGNGRDRAFATLRTSASAEDMGSAALVLFRTPIRNLPHPDDQTVLDSAEQFDFDLNGLTLRGYAWGNGTRVVALSHGWESHAGSMLPLVLPLVAEGYRVIAFDAPAHGKSEGEQTSMFGFAAAMTKLRQKFGELHALVGHSIGGTSAALSLEDEPGSKTLLVLISSPCDVDIVLDRFAAGLKLPDAAHQHFRQLMIDAVGRPLSECSITHSARARTAPTLIIHDQMDPIVGFEQSEKSASALPATKFVVTSGLGHRRILKDADVIAAVVTFMKATRN